MTLVLKVNCRACNRECGDYKHLLDETLIDDEATTLAALLNYTTSLECFDENDDFSLPEHICNSCVEHLLQSFLFKEMVLQNDRSLRELVKRELEESQPHLEIVQEVEDSEYRVEVQQEAESSSPNQCNDFEEQEIDVGDAEEESLRDFFAVSELEEKDQRQTPKSPVDEQDSEEIDQDSMVEGAEYEMEEWLEIDDGTTTTTTTTITQAEEYKDKEADEPHHQENYVKIEESETSERGELILAEVFQNDSTDETKDGKESVKKISRKKFVKHGGLTEDDLKCQYCGKQFDKMCRLREHTYVHTGEKPHVCKICGKRSRTKTHYNVHMLTHSEQKKYRCNICGQHYRTSTSLRVHERKHSDIRPYACTICDKTFHTSEQKKLHIMIHTGERPYVCDVCGKSYRESHSLKQHTLSAHGDKKPYECEVCGKGLTQMSGYKRHMLLHTNEYPFSCDICGRPFRISSNLVAHKRLHLDVLPYQCTICEKGFNNTTRLKRHMAQHDQEPATNSKSQDSFKPRKPRQETIIVDTKMAKSRVVEII